MLESPGKPSPPRLLSLRPLGERCRSNARASCNWSLVLRGAEISNGEPGRFSTEISSSESRYWPRLELRRLELREPEGQREVTKDFRGDRRPNSGGVSNAQPPLGVVLFLGE